MGSPRFGFTGIVVAVILGVACSPVSGTSMAFLEFDYIVEEAGFVGIVECVEAGSVVATFKVVESWFGPAAAGTTFRIRFEVNPSGPTPYALCGERFLVAPFLIAPSERNGLPNEVEPGPLTWRRIPADYLSRLGAGVFAERLPIAGKDDGPVGDGGIDIAALGDLRKAVNEMIGTNASEREVLRLRQLCESELFGNEARALNPQLAVLRQGIQDAAATEIVQRLLAHLNEPSVAEQLPRILSKAGGPASLKLLEQLPAGAFPGGEEELGGVLRCIRRRLGIAQAEEPLGNDPFNLLVIPVENPTRDQLKDFEEQFAARPTDNFRVMATLIVHDPEVVAKFLLKRQSLKVLESWPRGGYITGSAFGHYCESDRSKWLHKLLGAKDPFVRVAAAVYLQFDNPHDSTEKLKEFMKLKGDAGAWAALTLARHGDKSAVPRLINFFREFDEGKDWTWGEEFGHRIRVLLSNSAQRSGIEQPVKPPWGEQYEEEDGSHRAYQKAVYQYYADWWKKNGDKVELYDPWLDLLAKQRID